MSQFNTIAGWVLAGGIVALGASIVAGEAFHTERPEEMGYHIEGVEAQAGAEDQGPSLAEALNTATVADGEQIFKRCQSCHTINAGGANGIGPNLHEIVGDNIATGRGGFAFSDALKSVGGSWTFENLDAWLTRPSNFASGTKMSFAGLGDIMDRAAVILYLNSQGSNLPLPPPPAAEPAADEAAAEGGAPGDDEVSAAAVEDATDNEGDAAGAAEVDE